MCLFISFWLCWVFAAVPELLWLYVGLSLLADVGATPYCSARSSRCGGFSAVERGFQVPCLSRCGAQPQLPSGMWDLPGLGIEPMSPAFAGDS